MTIMKIDSLDSYLLCIATSSDVVESNCTLLTNTELKFCPQILQVLQLQIYASGYQLN
jgi:hypothetical protein